MPALDSSVLRLNFGAQLFESLLPIQKDGRIRSVERRTNSSCRVRAAGLGISDGFEQLISTLAPS